jgi:uncharacterized protein YfaS (alpha-2-macroglobulin family)
MKKLAVRSGLLASFLALAFVCGSGAQSRDYLYEADQIQSLAPGTQVQLLFQVGYEWTGHVSSAPLSVQAFRLSPELALEAVRAHSTWRGVSDDLLQRAVRISHFSTNERLAGDVAVRVVNLGRLPIGEYAVSVQYGTAKISRLLSISTMGIVRETQGTETVFWAVDLRSFATHAGPSHLRLTNGSQTVDLDFVDGLARYSGEVAAQAQFFATTADGSIATDELNGYGRSRSEAIFSRFDRPLYRPGQDVHFRAVLRDGSIGAYVVPSGVRPVRITDGQGTVMYGRDLPLDAYGSIHGDFSLPEDAQLGTYQLKIGDNNQTWFEVQAYKKPEYEINISTTQPIVVRGDRATFDIGTAYFFGRPAAGLHLHYSLYASGYAWWGYSPYNSISFFSSRRYGSNVLSEGDATTDDSGAFHLAFRAPDVDGPEAIGLNVDVRDASGRTVSAHAHGLIVPAALRVDVLPSEWFGKPGDQLTLSFATKDYEQHVRPNEPIGLEIVGTEWNRDKQRYDEIERKTAALQSDAKGNASYQWSPQTPGSYEIRATVTDQKGNKETTRLPFWVSSSAGGFSFGEFQRPAVIAAKERIAPYERARVLIVLPNPNRDVLVSLTTDRVEWAHVVHIAGYSASYAFDVPPDARRAVVSVSLPQENGVASGSAGIEVAPAAKVLRIVVKPKKARYAPGERAEFDIHATDRFGRPVQAQISVGVVDAALLALSGAPAGSITDTFYGYAYPVYPSATWYQPNRNALKTIAHVTTRAAGQLFRPGVTADSYDVNVPTTTTQPRVNFADTAYWTPAVVTDAHGNAKVSFTWPDNLTRWVAAGDAITIDSSVGDAKATALVTKDFLVRLETPRFIRKGDKITVVGIAHGMIGSPSVHLRLDTNTDPIESLLTLDRTLSANTAWTVNAGQDLGDKTFTLWGSDGRRTDAMRLTIPVEAIGTAEHVREAGQASDRPSIALALPSGYDSGALRITLTPSLVAQLVQNVRLLDVYPYYCTEQTMSAALPAVFVDRVLARAKLARPGDIKTASIVRKAIRRLQELQHGDGSWGWWEQDQGHPFMTAYALYGLAEFRHAGYAVPDYTFNNGLNSLISQLRQSNTDTLAFWGGAQSGSEWNTRAFMLFALADAAPGRVDAEILQQTRKHAYSLNPYALAVLGLAYHFLHQDDVARSLLADLNARSTEQGPYTYWSGKTWHYAWQDDPIETTAYALRLNAALDPQSPRVQRIVAFLRAEQHGSWWYTTKDTAAAIYAIAEAVPSRSSELRPDETVLVQIDGRAIRSLHIKSPVLDAAQAQIVVPASWIHNGSQVSFARRGVGELYWATDWTRYAPPGSHAVSDPNRSLLARLFPKKPPLQIQRKYSWNHPGAWRIGDEITVDVSVNATSDVQYVAVEDPFPAGVEYQPAQGQTGSDWSGMQFFDDRAVFFATKIYAGWPLELEYTLRVTNAGSYTAPAPFAYAMYGPPVTAAGDSQHVAIH